MDNNPSFGVEIKPKALSRYHCFSCNSSGDLSTLLVELRYHKEHPLFPSVDFPSALKLVSIEEEDDAFIIPDFEENKPNALIPVPFPESLLEMYPSVTDYSGAMAYLQHRSVGYKTAKYLDVRYDKSRGRAVFPIRDWHGTLVGLHGRDVTDTHPVKWLAYKYEEHWNKLVWYGENTIDPDLPVLMVEAIFDMISCQRLYKNTMCSLLAGLSKDKVQRVSGIQEVITFYDYGQGGDRAREALDKYMDPRPQVHLKPTKEQDDPGAMTATEIYEYLRGHLPIDLRIYTS